MTSPEQPSPAKKDDRGSAPSDPSAEQVATQYVEEQLTKARASLRRSRLVGIILVLVVLGYFGGLTIYLRTQFLRPKAAAELANAYAISMVQDQGPVLVDNLKEQVPALIQQIPDYVIGQLPTFRQDLENTLEQHFTQYCQTTAEALASHLDVFLTENKEAINSFIEAGLQPEGANELGAALADELKLYLKEPGKDGESIQDKLDESLKMLRHLNSKLDHLVNAKDLSPQDEKLRHAIAVIMKTVEREVPPVVK